MNGISDFDKEHIERLLDEVLGNVSFHGDTYEDGISMKNIKLHEIALNHIWAKLRDTAYQAAGKQEFSAVDIINQIESISKEHIDEVEDVIGLIKESKGEYMPKIKLTQELDYISGHLRYGHLELVVDADRWNSLSEEDKKAFFSEKSVIVVDDYEVEDHEKSKNVPIEEFDEE